MKNAAIHDLARLQHLAREGKMEVTRSAYYYAAKAELTGRDVIEILLTATAGDFQKSMESTREPGVVQDVYRVSYRGSEWYLKVTDEGENQGRIVSCKWRRRLPE